MYNLLSCELYKLRHSSGYIIMMFLSALCGIIAAFFFSFAELIGSGVNLSGHEAFYVMFTDLRTFLLIFAGVISGMFIGEDFACRAYQAELALGNSRFKVLLNKTFVYMIGLVSMVHVWQLFVVVIVTLVNGFGVSLTIGVISNMIRAILMFSIHISACSMLCVVTSTVIKSKGAIIAVNFLLLILVDGIFQGVSMLHETGFAVYMKTPFIQALLSSTPEILMSELISSVLIGLTVMVLLFVIALRLFQRAEFK